MKFLVAILFSVHSFALACNPYMTLGSPYFNIKKSQYNFVSNIRSENQGLTKEQFDSTLEKVRLIYNPIFQARGGELVFPESNWENSSVNGTVNREGNIWNVLVYGGYARHRLATVDALLFIACHEIGHHLGETHYYSGEYSWAAGEGQADYYSTLKCLKIVYENEDNEAALSNTQVPEFLVKSCEDKYKDHKNQLICQRSALAGFQMLNIFENGSGGFKFETPTAYVTSKTYHRHPEKQCRLDTYFAGSVCDIDPLIDVSAISYKTGTCNKADNYNYGLRPACWFNESDFQQQ